MGMRKYERQIARARLTDLGVGKVNKAMGRENDGVKNWRRALTGDTGKAAARAQIMAGRKRKAERQAARA